VGLNHIANAAQILFLLNAMQMRFATNSLGFLFFTSLVQEPLFFILKNKSLEELSKLPS
jgi:hypothetical protein